MPPPFLSDEMIRKMCPQNHPPPLTKVYNIAPRSEPNYLNVLPAIKPAPYKVNVPSIMNNMAVSLVKDRSDNAQVLMNAQKEVLSIYDKPMNMFAEKEITAADVNVPVSAPLPMADTYNQPSGNLRGAYNKLPAQ